MDVCLVAVSKPPHNSIQLIFYRSLYRSREVWTHHNTYVCYFRHNASVRPPTHHQVNRYLFRLARPYCHGTSSSGRGKIYIYHLKVFWIGIQFVYCSSDTFFVRIKIITTSEASISSQCKKTKRNWFVGCQYEKSWSNTNHLYPYHVHFRLVWKHLTVKARTLYKPPRVYSHMPLMSPFSCRLKIG